MATVPDTPPRSSSNVRPWLLYLIAAIVAVLPRVVSLDMPFERDEGAYACVADMIARGGMPYVDAFDHKPPGIYYIYHWSFLLFGRTLVAPRLAALLSVALACFLLARLVARRTGSVAAAIGAAVLLGFASTAPAIAGPTANTEIFTLPLIVAGVLLLTDLPRRPWLAGLAAGLSFGLAAMIKQPVALIGAATAAAALWPLRTQWKSLGAASAAFAGGASLPFATCVSWYAGHGQLEPFWDCFYRYNASYVAFVPLNQSLQIGWAVFLVIFRAETVLWSLALAGVFAHLKSSPSGENRLRWSWALGSAAAVALGRTFYPHYFIFLLPALSYSAGLILARLVAAGFRARHLLPALTAIIILCYLPVWNLSGFALSREIYGGSDLFIRTRLLGDSLYKHAKNSTAFVLGVEPELYFYADLQPVTRYIYAYPLVAGTPLRDRYRRELIGELSATPPDWFVVQTETINWSTERTYLESALRPMAGYLLFAVSRSGSGAIFTGDKAHTEALREGVGAKLLVFRRPTDQPVQSLSLNSWAASHGLSLSGVTQVPRPATSN